MYENLLGEKKSKTFRNYEMCGAVFVSIAASVLHFLYEWSGEEVWASLFSAVNESVWEHMKIFSLPYVVWAFVELCCIRIPFKRFVSGKVLSLYFMLIAMPVLFYAYSGILGKNIAVVDIISGFVITAITFIFSYKMIVKAPFIDKYFVLSIFLIVIYYFTIGYFSFLPPKINLFKDPVSGNYGLT